MKEIKKIEVPTPPTPPKKSGSWKYWVVAGIIIVVIWLIISQAN